MLEAGEFQEVYGLRTVQVPETYPSRRRDHPRQAFYHPVGSHWEVAKLVEEALGRRQPVLLGTTSITESEQMARLVASYVLGCALPGTPLTCYGQVHVWTGPTASTKSQCDQALQSFRESFGGQHGMESNLVI